MNEDIILENEILMVVYSRFPFLGFYSWDVTDRHKMNERKTQDQENKRHNRWTGINKTINARFLQTRAIAKGQKI